MSDKNIYQRLQTAKVALQAMPLKESGKNTFAGYTYMELGDFMPQINNLCLEHGLCGVIRFGTTATLTIVNTDKPEESIVFESPMSTAELKGCHPVQQLGAVQSYLRRYLWVAAFDIVEHDALDSTHGKDKPEAKQPTQAAKSATQSAPPSEADQGHIDRIKTALHTIFGDNKTRALDKVEEMTSFIPKDKTEAERVPGVRDFTKLKGQRLTILCSNLEKMAAKLPKEDDTPTICNACAGQDGFHTEDCPNVPF